MLIIHRHWSKINNYLVGLTITQKCRQSVIFFFNTNQLTLMLVSLKLIVQQCFRI